MQSNLSRALYIDLSKPCMWSKDYFDLPHVKAISSAITAWNDGLLTTQELVINLSIRYDEGYSQGLEDAHYPVPSTLGPVTQGLTPYTVIQWPADESKSALAVYHYSELSKQTTLGEYFGFFKPWYRQ